MHATHWSPAYARARIGVLWFQWNWPDAPWLTADAVRLLHGWLRPSHVGLEWGAGRSSVWLAGRLNRLVTIEHDPRWVEPVQRRLRRADASNVELRHVPTQDPGYPVPPHGEQFDFVLVDGRRRDECALAAMQCLRPGGLLVLDDAERYLPLDWRPAGLPSTPPDLRREPGPPSNGWERVAESLRPWPLVWTSDGVSDTCLAVRPLDDE